MHRPFDPESTAPADDLSGMTLVRDLLDAHPYAAIAVIDPGRDVGHAGTLLAASGIDIGTHPMLRGTAAAEFVAPKDAALVSSAAADARDRGSGSRAVHLRDGRDATLHLIQVAEAHSPSGFVMVIVPASGSFVDLPALNTSEVAARVGVLYADAFGSITRADESVISVLGQPRAEIEGASVMDLCHADDQETALLHWVAAKEQRGLAHRWRCRVVRGNGSLMWAEISLVNRIDDAGVGEVRIEFNDISREVAAADELARERSLLKQLTEALPVGVAKFDADGCIEYANARLARLLGRDPAAVVTEAIAGEVPWLSDAFSQVLREGTSSCFVSPRRLEHLDRDLEWTLRPVRSSTGSITGGVLCVADVTEATELRAALEERATTDALTGCLNWTGTINCIQSALMAATTATGIGLLFIDLDGFKEINDSYGHAIGDRVLEIVATRLRAAVRPLDRIGRLGGDEFVVMAPGLPSLDGARVLAARVSAELNSVASIGDLRVAISASIGVAWANSGDADELLAEADAAMYRVKCESTRLP
jgi:diguanylate cyclase (GGDEF)-like protein/PAS domain S-box-containing protein